MEAILSPASLERDIEALAAGAYLRDPLDLIEEAIALLTPPEQISTVDCAEDRKLPSSVGGAVVKYDRWRTPYNIGPMNSLDDPKCNLIVMPKPSRSGGTTVAENYLFKMMKFGPMGRVTWVLNTDEAVTAYCRAVVKPMFELNPDIQNKVGTDRGDDTDSFKRVRGYPVEWLAAKDSTFRDREPVFMVSDETDAWKKVYARSPKIQIEGRQKNIGNQRKGAIMSHPDAGWSSGVAAAYEDSSRGIYIMRCVECLGYASAFSTKFWPDVPQFKLHWTKSDSASKDDRLDLAERTACMLCPHCGSALDDEQRRRMVEDAARQDTNALAGWMHRGQTLDALEGVIGEMTENQTHGFWVHGLMLKVENLGQLAKEYEAALIDFERTKDPAKLREFMSKRLGEVFEGAASTGGVSANALKKRVKDSDYQRGTVPPDVKFITAAVDTGGTKFDVVWIGWDLEGRSWLIDRQTIRHRIDDDGQERRLHVAGTVENWLILLPRVVDRRFPIVGRPGWELPVACVCIDTGDGNVTKKAREFARRALRAGYFWAGAKGQRFSKIKLIKGFDGKKPMVPEAPRKVDKGEDNQPVKPVLFEYNLGVDALKSLTYERLAVSDGGPGQCYFAAELEGPYIDEFFGERLIDGKWIRSGPNETLDLYGYAEAARQMLKPDRADIKWDQGILPPWARPVPLQSEGGDPEAPGSEAPKPAAKQTQSILARFDALNRK